MTGTVPRRPGLRALGAADATDIDALFDDGKDAGALRTIGEVSRALGLRQHVLRYWEEQFPGLRPLTRAGNRRYYRREDIALLLRIDRLLHREGYTIRGARQALGHPAAPAMPTSAETVVPEEELVTALSVLRHHLESIRTRLADGLGDE